MNIILFGPPGIGKSTIIGILKSRSQRAIDLEDLYPNRIRFQIPNMVDNTYLGAADLNPQRKYNAMKVLLTAEQDAYDARRAARDARVSGKANQKPHNVEDWQKGVDYDLVIDTTKLTPEQVVELLLKRKEGH